MKKKNILYALAALGFIAALITGCDYFGTIRGIVGGLGYSVEVNNKLAARTVGAADTVELYIQNLMYQQDGEHKGLILVANGDHNMGTKGGKLDNAGWYSVNSDLAVTNDVNYGTYSSFFIRISKLRINGTEYDFSSSDSAVFGKPSSSIFGGQPIYPNNFSGITMTDSVHSLKTILTVDPDILDGSGNLASDPYLYIKVEGRVNE